MLKKRIIPILLLKDGQVVKGHQFSQYRKVGNPITSASVYNSQQADELLFLNTNSELEIAPLLDLIDELTEVVFMPISVGGGIRTFEHVQQLIAQGADKVVLNTALYDNPALIQQVASHFGAQAVVACIDVKRIDNTWVLHSHNGQTAETISLEQHINTIIKHGAGELMIQSIDNDGAMQGFDLQLAEFVSKLSSIPVILAGGSGNYRHLLDAFTHTDLSAIACGSLFNFSDSNPMRAMAYLRNYDLPFKRV